MIDVLSNMREQCANYGIRIKTDCHLSPTLMGFYDRASRTISLAAGMSESQRRVALCHEMFHALHDAQNTCDPDPQVEEAKTRRETAQTLISPIEYQLAEQMYGTNLWQIAKQLNVTIQVVRDWQTAVHDNPQLIRQ